METNYKEYYATQLEDARVYQDFCANIFITQLGVAITNYQSKKYQFNKGENVQGIEIKYDKKFRETGNLYIEVEEKSNPRNPEYVLSGIYRLDNSWLYSIGDYDTIYIFSKNVLQLMHKSNKYKMVQTQTSKGFLLPASVADQYSAKKINIKN